MSFSLMCGSKKCGKLMQPYIDPSTDKVYCSECDTELSQVTPFVKNQLKMSKKYGPKKKNVAFAVKCLQCGKENQPILRDKDILCPICEKPLNHLSEPFKIMLREKLKTTKNDI